MSQLLQTSVFQFITFFPAGCSIIAVVLCVLSLLQLQ